MAALAAPVGAQGPTIETLAEDLAAPRGITIGPDGAVYVVEAGAGGDTCMDTGASEGPQPGQMCYGPTGAVTRIADGTVEKVIDGLISAGSGPEVGGVSDISFIDDQTFYVIANLGGDPASRADLPPEMADLAGRLLRGNLDGSIETVADVAAFETDNNPNSADLGSELDSNPYSVATIDGGAVVADAGGNDLLMVDDSGAVSLVAVFPSRQFEFPNELLAAMGGAPEGEGPPPGDEAPAEGGTTSIPVQAVPTSVVVGPDGAYYVGQLTGGPFPVGGASVWRVSADGEVTEYATGFTNIIDLGFGPDGTLYVAELDHAGLMDFFGAGNAPVGAVLSVPPGGGEAQVVVSDERVMAPGGLTVGDDGAVYVSTGTLMPGAGAVVKIDPVAPPRFGTTGTARPALGGPSFRSAAAQVLSTSPADARWRKFGHSERSMCGAKVNSSLTSSARESTRSGGSSSTAGEGRLRLTLTRLPRISGSGSQSGRPRNSSVRRYSPAGSMRHCSNCRMSSCSRPKASM